MLAALDDVAPDAPTVCAGWTAHDVAAHLAAGAKELADLIEERLDGRPPRPTRGFEEREAPFRDLPPDELRRRLLQENVRKLAAYDALGQLDDPTIAFTGTRLRAEELATHSRSEAAIHRWDLVGDDDTSTEQLGQPELTVHAVKVLGAMPVLNESAHALAERAVAAGKPDLHVVLRSPGERDVVFVASTSGGRLELTEPGAVEGDAVVVSDAAQRLLALWGRRSTSRAIAIEGPPELSDVLWPDARTWA